MNTTVIRALTVLFGVNLVATLIHYADNVARLNAYPDLPTTAPWHILSFLAIMLLFGIAGFWLFLKNHPMLAAYFTYIYCALNFVVLGHYTASRLNGPVSEYGMAIHLAIFAEVLTALALLLYVGRLHWRLRRRGPTER
ncbi:CDP-diglyceride synthetase [Constrictibacter sp. MBR-5]|jgi:CDP-diglyceride synthetase|uniref:hypothetical protein n=1 Tax=Constrictibacter sp. MBR-5 TaxID=3156467 RepID=UPI00339A875C